MKNLIPPSVNSDLLLKIMLASSIMSVVLLSFRMYLTASPFYIFLAWNLFLAWIPFLCAMCIHEIKMHSNKEFFSFLLAGIWLLFFPNSPYIITDLFHLHPRPGMPLWFDLFLIISFAWNGLMLGFASLIIVQKWLSGYFQDQTTWVLVFVLMFLCGYGVYLGRFGRWNSWDVLANGKGLSANIFHDIFYPLQNLRMLGVTTIFGTFLLLGYLTLLALMNINKSADHGKE